MFVTKSEDSAWTKEKESKSFRSVKFAAGDRMGKHGAGHPSLSLEVAKRFDGVQVMDEKMMEMEKKKKEEEAKKRKREGGEKVDATKRKRVIDTLNPRNQATLHSMPSVFEGYCASHIEANDGTQDRVGCADRFGLSAFLVLDGHGGDAVAQHTQERLCNFFFDEIKAARDSESDDVQVRKAMTKAFEKCEASWLSHAERNWVPRWGMVRGKRQLLPGMHNAGTCALFVVVRKSTSTIFTAHVGDCRAVIGCTSNVNITLEYIDCRTDMDDLRKLKASKRKLGNIHGDFSVHRLTLDQTCRRKSEADAVRLLSNDPHAVHRGAVVSRVAGSLIPSRALGDLYLKHRRFSLKPYMAKLPPLDGSRGYISSTPEVATYRALSRGDDHGAEPRYCIVAATDGLWDHMTDKEAIKTILEFSSGTGSNKMEIQHELSGTHAASTLVRKALTRAAHKYHYTLAQILRLPSGGMRRQVFDDISIMCSLFTLGTPPTGKPTPQKASEASSAEHAGTAGAKSIILDDIGGKMWPAFRM